MPKSKTNPKRRDNVNAFKEKVKNKKMTQETNQPQIPEIRQVPIWKSQTEISMNGLEFEAIFNFINSAQGAYGAVQSIMNKNILNGNVQLDYEKLNEDKTQYVPMTDEEKAPHKAEFEQMITALKAQATNMVKRQDEHLEPDAPKQETKVVNLNQIVDPNGTPVSSDNQ